MYWLYLILACIVAFVGGIGMLFGMVYSGTTIWNYKTLTIITLFLMPALFYWLGIISAFLYALGEAFKGG